MIDYQEVKDVLENSINEIKKSLGSLGDSCKEIENYYNQNYLNYKDNIFRSIKDEEFQIGPNSFEKIFTESVDFLKSQLNFAEQLLSLDYVQNESRLSKYTNKIFENCINVIKNEYNMTIDVISMFFEILYKTNIQKKYGCLLLLKTFSQIEENIVLIGGNGSGKSSLANQLKGDDTETIAVIPAQKNLYFSINDTGLLTTGRKDLITLLFENNINKGKSNNFSYDYFNFQNNQFTRLIVGMQSEFTTYLYQCEREGVVPDKNKTVFSKLRTVFHILFPDIELRFDDSKTFCLSCIKQGEKYQVNALSEGEKVVIYYTISVLLAKENSFVIVDEPETYINPSLTNCLWDVLTDMRSDCQFIFITHSIDFVLGRTNSKIAWIKSYTYPDKWEFEILKEDQEFPKALMTEILGSKKSIVFCEGDNKASLDYHIYKAILGTDFSIIPVQGHRQVVEYCKAVNKLDFNFKAYGIIDGDDFSEGKVENYRNSNIYVLPFNEIEMFIIDDIILEDTMQYIYPVDYQDRINKFKAKFWERVIEKKEKIALNYVRQIINEHIETQKIANGNSLDTITTSLKQLSNLDVKCIYQNKIEELEELINNRNYKGILKVCNLKKEITRDIAVNELDKDYEEKVKQQIMTNEMLQEKLKSKYFQFLYS